MDCLQLLILLGTLSVVPFVVMNSRSRKLEFTKLENEKMRKLLYIFHQAGSMGSRVFAYRSTFTFDFTKLKKILILCIVTRRLCKVQRPVWSLTGSKADMQVFCRDLLFRTFVILICRGIKLRKSENAWTRNVCSFNYTPTPHGAFFDIF